MWMRTGCAASFNWSIASTCGRGCRAGDARRRSGGFWWPAEERIFARNANGKPAPIIFWYILAIPDSIMQTVRVEFTTYVIDKRHRWERSVNCYYQGASDVPAAGKYPASPMNSRIRQEQPPKKRPSKGKTGRRNLQKARWKQPPSSAIWEASDQRRTAKRHSGWSGVSLRLGLN